MLIWGGFILKLFDALPIGYVFQSRILTKAERISWFLIFPIFLLLPVYLNKQSFSQYFVCILVVISSYEIGYLYNDIITTKKELNPTLRHTIFHESHFIYCVLIRFCFVLSLSLYYCVVNDVFFASYLLTSCFVINVFFYLHNAIRSKLNILTYFFLVSSRYLFPIAIFCSIKQMITVILIFPICRTIEHACKRKYGYNFINRFVANPDLFRVKYLVFILLVELIIIDDHVSLLLVIYFLSIRLVAISVSHFKFFKRNKHQSYNSIE